MIVIFKLGHLYGSFTDRYAAELDIIPGMDIFNSSV